MSMNNQTPISETARRGLNALHRAVRKEVEKKSKLGQYVIISRQGKTVRILAADALREADHAQRSARQKSS